MFLWELKNISDLKLTMCMLILLQPNPDLPPIPSHRHTVYLVLYGGWEQYKTSQGRTFYYNYITNARSWKRPHRHVKITVSV
jgi:hypothetical protein